MIDSSNVLGASEKINHSKNSCTTLKKVTQKKSQRKVEKSRIESYKKNKKTPHFFFEWYISQLRHVILSHAAIWAAMSRACYNQRQSNNQKWKQRSFFCQIWTNSFSKIDYQIFFKETFLVLITSKRKYLCLAIILLILHCDQIIKVINSIKNFKYYFDDVWRDIVKRLSSLNLFDLSSLYPWVGLIKSTSSNNQYKSN